jgi:hypothetical protein
LSALRAIATTWHPSFASRFTIAAPMPRDPPVTTSPLVNNSPCLTGRHRRRDDRQRQGGSTMLNYVYVG